MELIPKFGPNTIEQIKSHTKGILFLKFGKCVMLS